MDQLTKRVSLSRIVLGGLFLVFVFASRLYNSYKYSDTNLVSVPAYYTDPTDISLYPTDMEGAKVDYIDQGGMQGFHFIPDEKKYPGRVICFGGSDGTPSFERAKSLAEKGYETFALFFFGMSNQKKTLTQVPIEQFEDVIKYINENTQDSGQSSP